ncbi:hypothetical protein QBC47DRAFT_355280 [Echria macrotheca]|uniref:Uncharacterized protein n=1 Tax=Echria macrotheca TaxID=438768 RepID=A0AAJ0FE66_9PEZI|nr:hypothetical protein QBC47DRAFT_355280 [Echria macrotheca]
MRASESILQLLLLGAPVIATSPFWTFAPAQCNINGVLEFLTCRHTISEECLPSLTQQADDFCRDYLGVEPVTITTTLTGDLETATATATELSTTTTTSTDITTTTTFTTEVDLTTTTTVLTSTSTVTWRILVINKRTAMLTESLPVPTGCPDLRTKNLERIAATKLSAACSCLDLTAATSTIDATTTPTTTTTTTETDVSTALETTSTTATESTTTTESSTITSSATQSPVCPLGVLSFVFTT